MNKTTFIYALTCPDTNEVRYVGKADNPQERLKQHIGGYGNKRSHKSKWVKSLLDTEKCPGIVILEEVPLSEWVSAEKKWIEHYRSMDVRLTNITDGGQGGRTRIKPQKDKPDVRFTIVLSDDLGDWIKAQAKLNRCHPGAQLNKILTEIFIAETQGKAPITESQNVTRVKTTVDISSDLDTWLAEQARQNRRSKTRHVEYLLEQAKREDEKQRHSVGLTLMCSNGHHNFKSLNPAMNEFCNCGVFVYGEVYR